MKSIIVLSIPASFFIGLLIGRGKPPAAPLHVEPLKPPTIVPVEPDVPSREKMLVEAQRHEIQRLKEELKSTRPPAAAAGKAPDKTAQAKELYELFCRAQRHEIAPDEKMDMVRRLTEFDPEMAAWFIEQYRRCENNDQRGTALMCILLSGGADASRFAAESLRDPAFDAGMRRQTMRSLAGLDDMPTRAVAEPSLTRLGLEWARSTQHDERATAAGILGLGGAAEGPVQLRLLADTDSSENVRAAAIQAIGRSGDAEAQAYLKGLAARTDLSDYLRRYIKVALGQSERRLGK